MLVAQFPHIWDAATRASYDSELEFVKSDSYVDVMKEDSETWLKYARLCAFGGYLTCICDEVEKAGAPAELESLYRCTKDHLLPCCAELKNVGKLMAERDTKS